MSCLVGVFIFLFFYFCPCVPNKVARCFKMSMHACSLLLHFGLHEILFTVILLSASSLWNTHISSLLTFIYKSHKYLNSHWDNILMIPSLSHPVSLRPAPRRSISVSLSQPLLEETKPSGVRVSESRAGHFGSKVTVMVRTMNLCLAVIWGDARLGWRLRLNHCR